MTDDMEINRNYWMAKSREQAAEIDRLRAENEQLQEEIERLKKEFEEWVA